MSDDVRVKLLGAIIAEFILVGLSTLAYNKILAVPLGLPQVNYWQMWIIRLLLGYMATNKLL